MSPGEPERAQNRSDDEAHLHERPCERHLPCTMTMRNTLLLLIHMHVASALVQLKTSTRLHDSSQQDIQKFLATPSNWPRIVLSSWSVEGDNASKPLQQSQTVTEIFGLPPILPLGVTWKCVESTKDCLDVQSTEGVPGLASDARMLFDIQQQEESVVVVDLTMEYEPENVLGILAIPILAVDNALALKVLLPYQLQRPLQKFQTLMGTLYGIAGVAHFVDLVFGDSQILLLAGCDTFTTLPVEGQALALLWCAAGPASFVMSRVAGLENAGLIGYGMMEVACAALVSFTPTTSTVDPLMNALGVQAVVAASYLYSSQKQKQESI